MTVLAPIWLWLLLPWGLVCWWAIRESRIAARVPFLHLWPKEELVRGTRRGRPPLWLMCILAGLFLAILAAAGLARLRGVESVTLIVDRSAGLTPRRLKAAESLLALSANTQRRVVLVPGEPFESIGPVDWSRVAPLAVSNEPSFTTLMRQQPGPILLISDQAIEVPAGSWLVRPPALTNAGIDHFGVTLFLGRLPDDSQRPAAQAMVRVWNGTTQAAAMLQVDQVRLPIDLPAKGQYRDYFIDLPTVGTVCEARLLSGSGGAWEDDVAGDDHAYLARGGTPARVDAPEELPEILRKMIGVYERHRGGEAKAAVDSPRVRVVQGEPVDQNAVAIPASVVPGDNGEIQIDAHHPITRSADLSGVRRAGRSAAALRGEGWRVLIRTADGAPLLAARELPARQVWIGFDSGVLADRADYVVFWTDVFDWLAGTGEFSAEPVRGGLTPVRVADASLEASPGIYQDAARRVATFMPAVRGAERSTAAAAISTPMLTLPKPLAKWLLAGAMALLAVGLGLYRNLTRF